MYQVLYRKWRPQRFADVVGQPQVTVTLQNELKSGRIAHAYLFTGSRGTGKTTCAKILAKAVNCLHPADGDPCGECEICRGIDSGAVTDVTEIDAASNNGVDNIRDLREEVQFTPAEAKYRVYIIDEVHMLSPGAFNALLKTLEEPPAHVVFILATTEVHKLPATILSRCQRFDFHRIAPEAIADRLAYVCAHENAEIDREAALLIARLSDGALRDALSLLDQCLGRSAHVTEDVVTEAAGLAGQDHLFALTDAIIAHDAPAALQLIASLHAQSKDMARLCEELIGHFRNLMLFQTMQDPGTLVAAGAAERAELARQAQAFTLTAVLAAIGQLQACLEAMSASSSRRVEMEMTVLRLCSPELAVDVPSLLRRMEQLEQTVKRVQIRASASPAPETQPAPAQPSAQPAAEPSAPPGAPEPSAASQPAAPQPHTLTPMAEWPQVVEALQSLSPGLAAVLEKSQAYIDGDYCLIDAPNHMAFDYLRNGAGQKERMREALLSVTGRRYRLGPYKAAQPAAAADPLNRLSDLARQMDIPVTETSEKNE